MARYEVAHIEEGEYVNRIELDSLQEANDSFSDLVGIISEYNQSESDGAYLWDTHELKMIAEFCAHNNDGGSLQRFDKLPDNAIA